MKSFIGFLALAVMFSVFEGVTLGESALLVLLLLGVLSLFKNRDHERRKG